MMRVGQRLKATAITAGAVAAVATGSATAQTNTVKRCRVSAQEHATYEVSNVEALNMPPSLPGVVILPGKVVHERIARCDLARAIADQGYSDYGRSGRSVQPFRPSASWWRYHYTVSTDAPANPVSFTAHVVVKRLRSRQMVTFDLSQEYSNDNAPWEHCSGGSNSC
jgi:hypothetical protein